MRTTIKTGKEQLTRQYFAKLDKFEGRLESEGIETSEYYELLDILRSYTMISVKEEQAKRDSNVSVLVLDDSLERTVLEGVMISPSSVFVITETGRREVMRRLQSGTLSEVI
ncbi:hypothetical protein ACNOIU_15965 (plasmid) [Exiguobacterium mexicanum]|uniref:hypothetical protein n=1 Tax=Exiguobacterium mexicanum TaxID=340146 RepID=UPI003AB22E84